MVHGVRPTQKPRKVLRQVQKLGLLNRRNLFWSWYDPPNFGDWIGPYLFHKITGSRPLYCHHAAKHLGVTLFTAGSILRHIRPSIRCIVWGSGIIDRADEFSPPLTTLAVRGPRSRERYHQLGYSCPERYGDPAILLPHVYKPEVRHRTTVGIIPHFFEYAERSRQFGNREGVRVINVCDSVEAVIDDIASCETTISSSLHGLIVSRAYGIPCAWMRSSAPLIGDDVKFTDYYESCGIEGAKAVEVCSSASLADLVEFAQAAPKPEHSALIDDLWQSCPFGGTRETA